MKNCECERPVTRGAFNRRCVIDYGVYILVSLPIAYLAGGWVDKKIFEEVKEVKKYDKV